MATKADFTEDEWDLLHRGASGSGALVSLSDRGFWDTFKETGALAKHVSQARTSTSELVRELAATKGTGFGVMRALATTQKARTARSALALRDVAGFVFELGQKARDIGHAHAVREGLEHQLVVGGVAHIDPAVDLGVPATPPNTEVRVA